MSSMPDITPPAAIVLDRVGKCFRLHKHKIFIMQEIFARLRGTTIEHDEFWALRDVTLSIGVGESLAFVGKNGAGKSTLLGVIAGTIYPTLGTARVSGRIGALLELGSGFHPDLTGRENIYMNASLLGLRKNEVDARFDQIVEFSEIREFIDVPLRNYSSGMAMRLGFAVAIHTDPDIMIMDEVFAVGDQAFQQKCLARVAEFKAQGKTMIFVSHGLKALRGICDRAVWLEHGKVIADGPLEDILQQYESSIL